MQLRQLEYFIAVSEQPNFTKAAKQFYISQTAVTLQIKALEEELGVTLFQRTNRKVALTPAGKTFLDDARAIIRRAKDAAERAKKADTGLTGHLNFGYIKGYEKTFLPDVLSEFHTTYPNISLSLYRDNVAELYDGIFSQDFDLIFNILYSFDDMEDMKEMEYVLLKEYPLLAVMPVSHPLSHRTSIRREELKGYPLVDIKKNEDKYGEVKTITNAFAKAGFLPDVQYVSDDIETSILAVAAGLGYALLPSYITDNIAIREKVTVIPLEGEERQIPVIAAWNKENANPARERFLEIVRQANLA